MIEKIKFTLALLIAFAKNPFNKQSKEIDDDESLVFVASVIAGVAILIKTLTLSIGFFQLIFSLLFGIAIAYIIGLLTVYIKAAIFSFYLKHIATPIFNIQFNDYAKIKQIATFSSIGMIVSAIPLLGNIGFIVSLVIEVLGLTRLFKLDLKNATLIAVLYQILWWVIFKLIF